MCYLLWIVLYNSLLSCVIGSLARQRLEALNSLTPGGDVKTLE